MLNKNDMVEIGGRLRQARRRAGLTQDEAATVAGVSRPTVSNWEAGRNLPGLLQFRALVSLYATAPFHILFGRTMFDLTRAEHMELQRAIGMLPPAVASRMDLMLQLLDPGQQA